MSRRALATLGAAAAGAAAGYLVHQLIGRRAASDAPAADLTIGAPLVPTVLGFGVGLVSGRRSLVSAAVFGFTLAAAAGPKIDLLIPPIRRVRERVASERQDAAGA